MNIFVNKILNKFCKIHIFQINFDGALWLNLYFVFNNFERSF